MRSFAPYSREITTPVPHHSIFYGPDALPDAQPTVSKHYHYSNITIDTLMGCGHVPATSTVDATAFHQYFDAKMADVQAITAKALLQSFIPSPSGCLLAE